MNGLKCLSRHLTQILALSVSVVFMASCEASQDPILSPTPTSEDSIRVLIDLPEGWTDLIDEYRREVPDTVMTAVWSTASELDTSEPFATVSVGEYGPDSDPEKEIREDLDYWESLFEDPIWGESGGFETEAGGAGRWGSMSGTIKGEEKTIISVHLYHGPYKLMVLIESLVEDEARANEILDALETVEFEGPMELEGRAGRPMDENGRWYSYCRTISISVQESWIYDFNSEYDRESWDCPTDVDYLGSWTAGNEGSEEGFLIHHHINTTLAEVHESISLPGVVGTSVVSPAGFTHTLVSQEPFVLSGGTPGLWSRDQMEFPSGGFAFLQLFEIETPTGGVVQVGLMTNDDGFTDDVGGVLHALQTLVVEDTD